MIANGKYSRAPSIDPDYPLVTEAFVPGVTLPNSNIPKFPKLTNPEELLSKAFKQIDQTSNSNSNSNLRFNSALTDCQLSILKCRSSCMMACSSATSK